MCIVSGLLDPVTTTASGSVNSSLMLERLLILINEVVNLQKVLLELVNNNELFNRSVFVQQTPTTNNNASSTKPTIGSALFAQPMSATNSTIG